MSWRAVFNWNAPGKVTFLVAAVVLFVASPAWALRIGVYSGTFSPPHSGHVRSVREFKELYKLDLVYVIPNLESSHKPGALAYKHREQMTTLAFGNEDWVVLPDAEIEQAFREGQRPGVNALLERRHPHDEFFQLMGFDSLERFFNAPTHELPRRRHVVVLPRAHSERVKIEDVTQLASVSEQTAAALDYLQFLVENRRLHLPAYEGDNISSTYIRKELSEGRVPPELHPSVANYLIENKLLGAERCLVHFTALAQ
jgi:nicotinate (nicotinamide) nucleotide adenylyltransferase